MGLAQFPEELSNVGEALNTRLPNSKVKHLRGSAGRAGTPTSYKQNGVVIEIRTYTPWGPAPQDRVSPKIPAVPAAIWTLLAAGNLLDLRGDTLAYI